MKELYGDLAKPGVQQAGKALSTIIGLGNTVLWPVALLNEKSKIALENNLEKYRLKMEKVSEEDTCEVPPEIGVPIAEKLSYVTNEALSEMYIELLANASQHQNANVAHPSFVNVITNISPDEAILIRSIRNMPGIPFIEVRLTVKNKNVWTSLDAMKPGLLCFNELRYPNNVHAYLSNLEGLGTLQIRQDIFMVGENIYEPLEANAKATYGHIEKQVPDRTITFQRGQIEITPFTRLLMKACFSTPKA
ncbi:MAG: DUF4393 domain-containing protein [Acidithiobacillus ferrivorans]